MMNPGRLILSLASVALMAVGTAMAGEGVVKIRVDKVPASEIPAGNTINPFEEAPQMVPSNPEASPIHVTQLGDASADASDRAITATELGADTVFQPALPTRNDRKEDLRFTELGTSSSTIPFDLP